MAEKFSILPVSKSPFLKRFGFVSSAWINWQAESVMNVSAAVFSFMAFTLGFRVWLGYREKSDSEATQAGWTLTTAVAHPAQQ